MESLKFGGITYLAVADILGGQRANQLYRCTCRDAHGHDVRRVVKIMEWKQADDTTNANGDSINTKGFSRDEFLRRARREGNAAQALTDCNYIVTVHHHGRLEPEDTTPRGKPDVLRYVVITDEWAGDLRQWWTQRKEAGSTIQWREVAYIGLHVAQGLKALHTHENGYIHRDVKPQNILWREDASGQLIFALTDLGLAHDQVAAIDEDDFASNKGFGTEHYSAPEQRKVPPGIYPSTDWYSLALTLIEVMAGDETRRYAWHGSNAGSPVEVQPIVDVFGLPAPQTLLDLLVGMAKKHHNQRPSNVVEQLQAVLEDPDPAMLLPESVESGSLPMGDLKTNPNAKIHRPESIIVDPTLRTSPQAATPSRNSSSNSSSSKTASVAPAPVALASGTGATPALGKVATVRSTKGRRAAAVSVIVLLFVVPLTWYGAQKLLSSPDAQKGGADTATHEPPSGGDVGDGGGSVAPIPDVLEPPGSDRDAADAAELVADGLDTPDSPPDTDPPVQGDTSSADDEPKADATGDSERDAADPKIPKPKAPKARGSGAATATAARPKAAKDKPAQSSPKQPPKSKGNFDGMGKTGTDW